MFCDGLMPSKIRKFKRAFGPLIFNKPQVVCRSKSHFAGMLGFATPRADRSGGSNSAKRWINRTIHADAFNCGVSNNEVGDI